MMMMLHSLLIVVAASSTTWEGDINKLSVGAKFKATDTLAPARDDSEDATKCLDGVCWSPGKFVVHVDSAVENHGDWLVRYPSPVDSGNKRNDLVAMEWYQARDDNQNLVTAPAVVVVHESGSGMTVGRLFARGLQLQGLHDSAAPLRRKADR
jgi:hypothetical protein